MARRVVQGGGDIHFTLDMVYGAEPKQVKATALVKRDISKGGPSITPEGKGNNECAVVYHHHHLNKREWS